MPTPDPDKQTPRTDAILFRQDQWGDMRQFPDGVWVRADFARTLEMESATQLQELQRAKRVLQAETKRADYALEALAACLAQVGGSIFIDDLTVHSLGLPRPDVYDVRDESKQGRKLWVEMPARPAHAEGLAQGGE